MNYGKYHVTLPGDIEVSCDSLIADFKFDKLSMQKLLDWISSRVLWSYDYSERFGGLGKYKYAFTFDFQQESTVTLLVGLFSASGLTPKVRLDFNPNKVSCSQLQDLLLYLRLNCKSSDLVRWDLAIDFPYVRRDFLLVRTDQRKRGLEETSVDNFTEYLGRRNSPGRYKLYNKTVESGLEYPLTRSELTCDGSWTAQECINHLPVLYRFEPFAEDGLKQFLTGTDLLILREMVLHPEDAVFLDLLDHRKRKSLRSILAKCSADSSSCHQVVGVDTVERILNDICNDIVP